MQNGAGHSVRLLDVAQEAEVSTATVSRALNDPAKVRPDLAERVHAAIRRLGYVPHGAARALASQRSQTVGAVVPTLDNAIFARGIEALQQRLSEDGYTLLLAMSEYDLAREVSQVGKLIERGIDGLMLIGEAHDPRLYAMLDAKGLPYVNSWVFREASPHPCIGFKNKEAAHRIASYLIDIGHRDIAMIAGVSRHNDRAADRIVGVRQAMTERGLQFPDALLVERHYDVGEGRQALRQLFDRPTPPTAVICGNDVIAFGALFEARTLGVKVPLDLSIVGFDDLDLASQVDPPLTTMHVPSVRMGKGAAEYLLARLAGEKPPNATELEASLIVRGTTAPPHRQ
ncbi:LacI family DNA-binding transcriptional regulator [Shumkonia mesophila]|uniref:LacI family DNA-binding transcriptional regulator n=1 Tax=Shumkonia mesophila TaxID=2838854 RepID=UPI0029351A69|nr:LacI family DNA-binding transcriptional regulator [Shumkonia mesophila]